MWTWQSGVIGRVCGGGKLREREEEEGGSCYREGSRRGKRGPCSIRQGLRGQALVGLFFQMQTPSLLFSRIVLLLNKAHFSLQPFNSWGSVSIMMITSDLLFTFTPFFSSLFKNMLFTVIYVLVPKLH